MSALVGYGKVCITPGESVPLGGYGNSEARMSQKVLSDLYAACVAFSDGENTVLLFHLDLLDVKKRVFDPIRRAISEATGVPFEKVLICATHTHSGPDMGSSHPSVKNYIPALQEQLVHCAQTAMADRALATAAIADTKTEKMSYVRHYILEDGSYKGVNLNVLSPSPILYHSSEPDSHMQLIRFQREGKREVLLVNWQAHPHLTGFGKADLSADVVGVMREEMEKAWDCDFIYFSGASGNLNILSFDQSENYYPDHISHGKKLAQYAKEQKDAFTPVQLGKVRHLSHFEKEPFYKPDDSRMEAARDVADFWAENKNYRESLAYAESKGFHSQYHATSLLLKQRLYKEGMTHVEVEMYAFSVGELGFVTAPYEMFDTNGKYIRDFSPFKATVVATCANNYISYIPSAYGYLNACYEADCTRLTPGAGERLAQKYVKLLEKLKNGEEE